MAGKFNPWVINRLIDWLFRDGGEPGQYDWYLALLTADPPVEEGGSFYLWSGAVEASYTGYARQRLNFTATSWKRTDGDVSAGASSGTTGETSPASRVYFPLCTTSTQLITHAALVDTNVVDPDFNYGYAIFQIANPIQLQNTTPGFYPVISPDSLKVRIG